MDRRPAHAADDRRVRRGRGGLGGVRPAGLGRHGRARTVPGQRARVHHPRRARRPLHARVGDLGGHLRAEAGQGPVRRGARDRDGRPGIERHRGGGQPPGRHAVHDHGLLRHRLLRPARDRAVRALPLRRGVLVRRRGGRSLLDGRGAELLRPGHRAVRGGVLRRGRGGPGGRRPVQHPPGGRGPRGLSRLARRRPADPLRGELRHPVPADLRGGAPRARAGDGAGRRRRHAHRRVRLRAPAGPGLQRRAGCGPDRLRRRPDVRRRRSRERPRPVRPAGRSGSRRARSPTTSPCRSAGSTGASSRGTISSSPPSPP